MPRKATPGAEQKRFEEELRREFVVGLHRAGKSYAYIQKEVTKVFKAPIAKSTIGSIIKRFKDRTSFKRQYVLPDNGKLSKQYVCACFSSFLTQHGLYYVYVDISTGCIVWP